MPGFRSNLALIAANCVVSLLLVEIVGRLLLTPYEGWHGALFGIPLPPVSFASKSRRPAENRKAPYQGVVVDGRTITVGDIAGYHRYDAVLGYAPLENSVSVNGWWHSNQIGARESGRTEPQPSSGPFRWLLVGESFAHGTGLPTAEGWAEVADSRAGELDIVNLAVSGYSMAQAYLRYHSLAALLQHQGVLLMFVPDVDLWRDVNTLRDLGEPWEAQAVMPRFVLEGDSLRLVPSPYGSPEEFDRDNWNGLSSALKEHLARYDRFYFPGEHNLVPGLGSLLTYRVAVAAYGRYQRGVVRRALLRPRSEGLEVSRRLFLRLQKEAEGEARQFVLLILPTATDLRRLHDEPPFREVWQGAAEYACGAVHRCVDLAGQLAEVPKEEIDFGFDGTHYGRRMNARIASAVLTALGTPPHLEIRSKQQSKSASHRVASRALKVSAEPRAKQASPPGSPRASHTTQR